jgi:Ca2+-transporting ATPase
MSIPQAAGTSTEIPAFKGLPSAEVEQNRALHGTNVLYRHQRESKAALLLKILREPMFLLLLVGCAVYFFTGKYEEGIMLSVALCLVAGLSFYQEAKSENALSALRKLSQPRTNVIRNGKVSDISSEEVVVGDVVIIIEGEQLVADGVILQANDLTIDESILTGESFVIAKSAKEQSAQEQSVKKDDSNILRAGTTVTTGKGYMRVTAVGSSTELGRLGKSLEEIIIEKTPLQKQVQSFVGKMALAGGGAFLLVLLYTYWETRSFIQSILSALTMAMSVLPEEIPVALSSFMALGAYRMMKENILVKQPQTVETLGSATVICTDKTGTLTENRMTLTHVYDAAQKATILCNDYTKLVPSAQRVVSYSMWASEPKPFDQMEIAIHTAYSAMTKAATTDERPSYSLVHEYPLSGKPPSMTHVFADTAGNKHIACKGAPEAVFAMAHLSEEEIALVMKIVSEFASQGLRVLGVASATFEGNEFPESPSTFLWTFEGLVAFQDPPKANIRAAIQDLHRAGIGVKIITGDYKETASYIAKAVGITNADRSTNGVRIMEMTDDELRSEVRETNIFARMFPEAKLRVINALKANDDVVAMTGDGVNDGPALKAAHIGIAMGKRGTEIAKQAASMVLLDDDIAKMVNAVAMGRRIYANLKKSIQYIISIHIPIIAVVTIPLILNWKFHDVFTPIHIIILELIMGPTCSIVFENEPIEPNAMQQPPRKSSSTFFTWSELSVSIVQGCIIAAAVLGVLWFAIETNLSDDTARTLVFSTLAFANIFLTLVNRSSTAPLTQTLRTRNNVLPIAVGIMLAILLMSYYVPFIRDVFRFAVPTTTQIGICLGVAALSVLWIEGKKMIQRQRI